MIVCPEFLRGSSGLFVVAVGQGGLAGVFLAEEWGRGVLGKLCGFLHWFAVVEPAPEGLAAKGRKEGRKKGGHDGDEGMRMGKTDFALQRMGLRMFEKRG